MIRTTGVTVTNRNSSVASTTRHQPRSRTSSGGCVPGSEAPSFIATSLCLSPAGVRQQCEIAGLLDGLGQLALVTSIHAAQPTRKNLAVVGDEAGEKAFVLVINEADAGFGDRTRLLGPTHGVSPHRHGHHLHVCERPAALRSSAARRARARAPRLGSELRCRRA